MIYSKTVNNCKSPFPIPRTAPYNPARAVPRTVRRTFYYLSSSRQTFVASVKYISIGSRRKRFPRIGARARLSTGKTRFGRETRFDPDRNFHGSRRLVPAETSDACLLAGRDAPRYDAGQLPVSMFAANDGDSLLFSETNRYRDCVPTAQQLFSSVSSVCFERCRDIVAEGSAIGTRLTCNPVSPQIIGLLMSLDWVSVGQGKRINYF